MKNNEKERPVGGNQIARAFAWKVADFLADDGEVALFMPAMALYEYPAASFRREFFQDFRVHTVANFSNLEEVLSGGRFRLPAVPFFYKHREEADADLSDDEFVRVYSRLSLTRGRHGLRNPLKETKLGVSSSTPVRFETFPFDTWTMATAFRGNL